MAPRIGTQRIDLWDVYESQKREEDKYNPSLISLGGTVGGALGDRDRAIEYERLLALNSGDQDAIKAAFGKKKTGEALTSLGQRIGGAIKSGASSAWDAIGSGASSAWKGIKSGAGSVWDAIDGEAELAEKPFEVRKTLKEKDDRAFDPFDKIDDRAFDPFGMSVETKVNELDPAMSTEFPFETTDARSEVESMKMQGYRPAGVMGELSDVDEKYRTDIKTPDNFRPDVRKYPSEVVWIEDPTNPHVVEDPFVEQKETPVVASGATESIVPEDYRKLSDNEMWSRLYNVDPERAKFDWERKVDVEKVKTGVYTPEQKQLIDARQQNRIQWDNAAGSYNIALGRGDTESAKHWKSQMDNHKAVDNSIVERLAYIGTAGYATPKGGSVDGGEKTNKKIEVGSDSDAKQKLYDSFANITTLSKIPNETEIVNSVKTVEGLGENYYASEETAKSIKEQLEDRINRANKEKNQNLDLAGKQESLSNEKYKNWLEQTLPGVAGAFADLRKMREGFVYALTQAKRNPKGGAYIAMKKSLGDALSGADFAGIAGFNVAKGLVGALKEKLGATPLDEKDAKSIIRESVNGFNSILADYDKRFADSKNPNNVKKAEKAFRINPLSFEGIDRELIGGSGSGDGEMDEIRTTTDGRKYRVVNGKRVFQY